MRLVSVRSLLRHPSEGGDLSRLELTSVPDLSWNPSLRREWSRSVGRTDSPKENGRPLPDARFLTGTA